MVLVNGLSQKWDRSHFLENLSGRETNCAMIGTEDWPFVQLRQAEIDYGMRISAVYGHARNDGSTQDAIERILPNFKQVSFISSNIRSRIARLNTCIAKYQAFTLNHFFCFLIETINGLLLDHPFMPNLWICSVVSNSPTYSIPGFLIALLFYLCRWKVQNSLDAV